MTHSCVLELELLSPTVLTADASTLGGHQTLHHIPGGLLKGALAARCYGDVLRKDGEQGAFRWFHSDALRIGDGLPLHPRTGEVGAPVPFALVAPKGVAPWTDGVLSSQVDARTRPGFAPTTQLRQLRGAFLTKHLHRVQPATYEHMRTAMGHDGRARDGHLFSESFLQPGQRFHAQVQADSAAQLAALTQALDQQEIRVGRGRSTGQGRVRVRVLQQASTDLPATLSGPTDRLVVWCLSDLALRDPRSGAATLLPQPTAHFGLPDDWVWVPEDSHLRSRSWSPFNGHRQRYDLERHVLCMGSVLVFRGPTAIDPQHLQEARPGGFGEHTGEGLGRVSLQPTLLVQGRQSGLATPLPAATAPAEAPLPKDRLGRWVERRLTARQQEQTDRKQAATWAEQLPERAVKKIGASQWSALAQVTRRSDFSAALEKFLDSGRRRDVESWSYARQGDTPVERVRQLAKTTNPRCVQVAAELARKRAIRLEAQQWREETTP